MSSEVEGSDFFTNQFLDKSFEKDQIITNFDEIENNLYFLKKGIVRFIVLKGTEEKTLDFAFEGEFFSAYSSFLTRQPSRSAIISLTNVECGAISYDQLQKVYAETDNGEKIGRIAAENLFIKKTKREMDLLTLDPDEKYQKLLKKYPHLVKHIPLKYLASYLGMTPETLSRVRSRIS
ncbi:cAMP-binding domain of CRP or a regulatory subunit of cAMP-dependent protein kinases [Fodinibius roseus]|uniref:cAMP-binding domain of CRP or a regulatory subunit of cAMP-dependent protein kinases n=1 Tax=Fodinibius roseus TaxID=1194090 RepID=A0A1M5HLQ5_9BACT|nr:Crp/Fnr family transcriptional regulator [Fodinibius roseus]SHG16772.1 cAMP-binding domain of CRP or a regulatory subunit of cAMP-dependent protein kinases [Fodinibius roseus]